MTTCTNCGSALTRRRCLSCAAQAEKAQPHSKSPLGFRLAGAGFGGVVLAGLLVLGVATTSKSSPEAALRQANATTKQAGTATFALTISLKTSGSFASKDLTLHGSGATNFRSRQTSLTMQAPGTFVEEVKDRFKIYLRTSATGMWTSVRLSKITGLSGLTGPSAFTPTTLQESAFARAVEVGIISVHGHACTNYDLPFPTSILTKYLEHELGSDRSGIGSALMKSLLKDVHVKEFVAVDNSSHLMRQITAKISMSIFGQTLTENIEMVLDHFGEPVNIRIPKGATSSDKLPSVF